MAAAVILNYYFVTLDNPRSPFVVLNLPFKFCIDGVYTFWDITIWKFCQFSLNCLFRLQKIMFGGGVLTPKLYFLFIKTYTRHILAQKHAFWALVDRDRSYGVIRMRREEYTKERTKSKPKFAIFADPLPVVNQILHVGSYPVYLCWFWVSERLVSWGQVMV